MAAELKAQVDGPTHQQSPVARRTDPGRIGIASMVAALALILAVVLLGGCARGSLPNRDQSAVVLVPGAGGNGPWYNGLRSGLADAGMPRPRTFRWGMPLPLYILNLQNRSVHAAAEKDLAGNIRRWRTEHPDGQLILVAHSAGCGVVLGALGRLDQDIGVDRVLLLAPSVSPGYDLGPALRHVGKQVHVFHSERDNLWLSWRTGTFGTYDNVRTKASGHAGFASVEDLPPDLRQKVVQHPYDPAWQSTGNDGEHWGPTARQFAAQVLGPLLQ